MLNLFKEWLNSVRVSRESTRRSRRRDIGFTSAQIELLESRTLLSATPALLKDINVASLGSNLNNSTVVGSTTYFSAIDAAHGNELWKSDGTTGGTALVADLNPFSASSSPSRLTNVNGTLFFVADDGIHGQELWKSDGTAAGTVLLRDLKAGANSSLINSLTNANGTLFFTADDGIHGRELWKSDGTAAGTQLVVDLNPSDAANASSIAGLTNVNGTLFFSARDESHGVELWKSDGTAAGTVLVRDILPGGDVGGAAFGSSPTNLTNVNGSLLFTANDGIHGSELWKSDGSTAGTVLVADISAASGSYATDLTNVNGKLYFFATDDSNGMQLWQSDGTTPGTTRISDVTSSFGSGWLNAENLTGVNGALFFVANDGSSGQELWKSDGTSAGTVQLVDILPGDYDSPYPGYPVRPRSSYPFGLTNVNGTLFFSANDGVHGNELWKSDGTAVGTSIVKDLIPGFDSGSPNNLVNANGTLLFSATDAAHGRELWKTNGTAAGTSLVKDINTQTLSSSPTEVTNVNGTLFFTAYDVDHGIELWKTDGSTAGTVLVKDIAEGSIASAPSLLTNVNGTLFFTAYDVNNRRQIWKSDGTTAGTVKISTFDYSNPNTLTYPGQLTNVNGTLFFTAGSPATGNELWKSDGTIAGTVEVSDIRPGGSQVQVPDEQGGGYINFPNSSFPSHLTNINGTLYFTANDGTSGQELWKSDGTFLGTVLVKDINPTIQYDNGPYGVVIPRGLGSYANNFTNVNGTLFFTADDGAAGQELWKTDGTSNGTVRVRDINPNATGSFPTSLTNVNGTLFFAANDGTYGTELWKSDGTTNGTALVKNIFTGSTTILGFVTINSSLPGQLVNGNGTLFFTANDGIHGTELWKSDGTSLGTVLVDDILPGTDSSSPAHLTNVNGTIYFDANDGISGDEIWTTDGTEAGTHLEFDLFPGGVSSQPGNLVNVNGTVYFTADDGIYGRELWSTALRTSTTTTLESTATTSKYGQVVTLKAVIGTASPGAGLLPGTVTFWDGAQILGTADVNFDGSRYLATFNLPANLAVGTHSLKAIYSGNSAFGTSTTSVLTLNVQKAIASITVKASNTSIVAGQPITLTAKMGVVAPGTILPSGSVTFKDGATILGTGSLSVVNGDVIATLTLSSLTVGAHSLTAFFGGNANFTGASSQSVSVVVAQAKSTLTLTSSSPTSWYGQAVTIKSVIGVVAPGAGASWGTVTFFDGSTALGTKTVSLISGQYVATFVLPANLGIGAHSLKAVYSGNSQVLSSTSPVITQTVVKAGATIFLKSSSSSSVPGQPVTLTVQVGTAPGYSGSPTGTVTFKDGASVLGTATLSVVDGKMIATLTTSALPQGTRSISAVYSGDASFNGRTSGSIPISVKATTKVTLSSNSSTSTYGQQVVVKASIAIVAPGTGIPTGTVTLYDGGNAVGSQSVSVSGGQYVATFTLPADLAVGAHSLKVTYSGDSNFSYATSPTITQTVQKIGTTISLASSSSSTIFGQPIKLTAQVGFVATGVGTPSGTVTFKDGTNTLGTGTLSVVNGQLIATLTVPALPVGIRALTAVYNGDAIFNGKTSAVLTQSVARATTTTTLSSTAATSVYGQIVTVKATISVLPPGAAAPSGTVSFFDGITYLGTETVSLTGGKYVASINLPATLAVGTHLLTAIFAGNINTTPSITTVFTQTVVRANTTLTLTASKTSSSVGQPVTFTATVAVVTPGAGVPTGTVTFQDGTKVLGTGTLSVVNGKIVATLTSSTLTAGAHSIKAIYAGDANFNAFTSAAVSLQIV